MKFFRFTAAALLALSLSSPVSAAALKGQPAPPFKVTTTSGQQVTLDNYRGRVLILDFFASWCPPCKESVPHLAALAARYAGRDVHVLGIGMDDSEAPLREFAAEARVPYPVALGSEALASRYGVRSIPTLFVIDRKGTVVGSFLGFSADTAKAMEGALRRALAR
ncbi:MAG TPA: TlpA disulfide reductase family protein [Verrucomicrobiae bacterium]|nr:TlpA disulfide reductase family protein [Verrucomicrobiae bacterium]